MIDSYQSLPYQPLRPAVRWVYRRFRLSMRGKQVSESIDGVTFDLDLGETIDSQLYYYGAFEKETKTTLKELCAPGFVVLDIGANIGAHTFFLARWAAPGGGKVLAFEPASYAYGRLTRNSALNPGLPIQTWRLGLGAEERLGWKVDVSCSWPVDKTFERKPGQLLPNAKVQKDSIDIVRLDDFVCAEKLTAIDLIKLDVDGHESNVLEGAQDTIERFKPIIVSELCDYTLRAYGSSAARLYGQLREAGYDIYDIGLWEPFHAGTITDLEKSNRDSLNIVAVHRNDNRVTVRGRPSITLD